MASTLIFDTETTGKALFGSPPNDPRQPRLCQLACALYDDGGIPIARVALLVRPDGWQVPNEAQSIHGHSTDKLNRYGVPIGTTIRLFQHLAQSADIIVAFNIDFDRLIIRSEIARFQKLSTDPFDHRCRCAMLEAKDHCKLPGQYGDFKWPKLSEAHQHFFGKPHDGAHDALADVDATARVWFEMRRLEAAKP